MRIDTHSHVLMKPFCGLPPTDPEKLLADFAECGLDGGWISSIDAMVSGELSAQKRIHDQMADMVRRHPGKLWAMCTVNPSAMEEAAREVERCVKDLGFIGVKIHPWLQAVSVVANPGMDLVMDVADDLRVPVLFHDGTPPYSTPRQIAFLAEKHPRVPVILGHVGLADLWQDAVDAGKRQGNIWLQGTCSIKTVARQALEAVGPDRMLFGCDSGFTSVDVIRYALIKFTDALGRELADRVISENPALLLGRLGRSLERR